ncbi:hypothetical protein D3C71_2101050 [compost metagenome]
MLGGHIHLPYVLPLTAGSAPAGWIVQAGTACSHRVRGSVPNSLSVITRQEQDGLPVCHVERWDYAAGTHAFAPVDKTLVTL